MPKRTPTRRTRRGLDSSCTASCSITSIVSPTAVGSLISTTVTADEGVRATGLVDSGEIFTVCGISIVTGTRQLGQLPKLPLLAGCGKLGVTTMLYLRATARRANRTSCSLSLTTWADHLHELEAQKETT